MEDVIAVIKFAAIAVINSKKAKPAYSDIQSDAASGIVRIEVIVQP